MKRVLQTLFDGQNLARTEAMRAMGLVLEGGVPSEQVGPLRMVNVIELGVCVHEVAKYGITFASLSRATRRS